MANSKENNDGLEKLAYTYKITPQPVVMEVRTPVSNFDVHMMSIHANG